MKKRKPLVAWAVVTKNGCTCGVYRYYGPADRDRAFLDGYRRQGSPHRLVKLVEVRPRKRSRK